MKLSAFLTLIIIGISYLVTHAQCPDNVVCPPTGLKSIHLTYSMSGRDAESKFETLSNYNQLIHVEPNYRNGDSICMDGYYALVMNNGRSQDGKKYGYNLSLKFEEKKNTEKIGIKIAELSPVRECSCVNWIIKVETCKPYTNDDCYKIVHVPSIAPGLDVGEIVDIDFNTLHMGMDSEGFIEYDSIATGKRICRVLLVD